MPKMGEFCPGFQPKDRQGAQSYDKLFFYSPILLEENDAHP